jgi:hypothetical protein
LKLVGKKEAFSKGESFYKIIQGVYIKEGNI